MKNIKKIFVCSKCDAQSSKWSGRCLECGSWGTLKEDVESEVIKKKDNEKIPSAEVIDLSSIKSKDLERMSTGISEVDRVLGGGMVPGSLILLSGEPGIGKSTIISQIASSLEREIVYASGEESAIQVKSRLERLNCNLKKIKFINETNVEKVISAIKKEKPSLVIVDSIQTVYSSMVESEAGSVSQIRASTVKFLELAKGNNISVILVGHITKDGHVAGPKTLEHIVDTVVYLEVEKNRDYRILRAVKNRFGSINEIGIFEMTSSGFKEIKNPSLVFVDSEVDKKTGSVMSVIMEGTRPFLIEVQALASKTVFGYPQRKVSGYDVNRLQMLSSVLSKRGGVNLLNQDLILNIVGGLKIFDPAMDLAVCYSIISSLLNRHLDQKCIILGEVGLGGEIRNISKLEQRIKEAKKMGYNKAIIPNVNVNILGIELIKLKNIAEIEKNS